LKSTIASRTLNLLHPNDCVKPLTVQAHALVIDFDSGHEKRELIGFYQILLIIIQLDKSVFSTQRSVALPAGHCARG
jgi:hypothetical protein